MEKQNEVQQNMTHIQQKTIQRRKEYVDIIPSRAKNVFEMVTFVKSKPTFVRTGKGLTNGEPQDHFFDYDYCNYTKIWQNFLITIFFNITVW